MIDPAGDSWPPKRARSDWLAADDPAAMRSRRDLQRVHRVMGTRGIVLRALRDATLARPAMRAPLRVLELGAGDGSLMLGVARALGAAGRRSSSRCWTASAWSSRATLDGYAELGLAAPPQVMPTCSTGRQAASPNGAGQCALGSHRRQPVPAPFRGRALATLLAAIACAHRAFLRLRAAPCAAGAGGQPPDRRARRECGDARRRRAERACRFPRPANSRALWPGASARTGRCTNIRPACSATVFAPSEAARGRSRAIMNTGFDAIIIGAGPAGSTAAILLARAGWSVALVEKQRFPRRKVCGECIAASNLPLLDALGIGAGIRRQRRAGIAPGRADARRAHVRRRPAAPPHMTSHAWGRALGRETLDTLLLGAGPRPAAPWCCSRGRCRRSAARRATGAATSAPSAEPPGRHAARAGR